MEVTNNQMNILHNKAFYSVRCIAAVFVWALALGIHCTTALIVCSSTLTVMLHLKSLLVLARVFLNVLSFFRLWGWFVSFLA